MLQKLQEHLKLSEKNREIEKNRYKKKIDALKTELHGIQLKKPAAIDLLSNSSDDDQDEADDFEHEQNDLDDEENRNVHFQEQSSSTIPAVSGHSMPAHNDNGPCKHSSDGQHPDFGFSDDSDFDMNEWEEDQNSKPKVVLRRRTTESKKTHSKGKKNKKN
jgi:hypothetical protein